MFNGIIYKYTSPSGKVYIGQTYNEKERRRNFISKRSYGGKAIDNAREKYGPSSFKYEVLFQIQTDDVDILESTLNEKEIYYIELYDSINNGYNIEPGGSKYHTYVYTDEIKQKMGKQSAKAIIQFNLNGEYIQSWESASEASRVLGVSSTLISNCCLRKTKHCRDFIFRFAGDSVLEHEKNPCKHNTSRKKVYKYLNGQLVHTWNSTTAASKDLGIERHTLKRKLSENDLKIDGFIISYTLDNDI